MKVQQRNKIKLEVKFKLNVNEVLGTIADHEAVDTSAV